MKYTGKCSCPHLQMKKCRSQNSSDSPKIIKLVSSEIEICLRSYDYYAIPEVSIKGGHWFIISLCLHNMVGPFLLAVEMPFVPAKSFFVQVICLGSTPLNKAFWWLAVLPMAWFSEPWDYGLGMYYLTSFCISSLIFCIATCFLVDPDSIFVPLFF